MQSLKQQVDHLYRTQSGKMVSTLTRIFGSHHLSIAEDVVQDTFQQAFQSWEADAIPVNPPAWLMLTAKRKAINIIRRDRHLKAFAQDIDPLLKSEWSLAATVEEVFLDDEIQDSQLRMMFTCCHPTLPPQSQLALTLKSLCGFNTAEIARALLSTEEAIQKKLYRAKQRIIEEGIKFSVPVGKQLDKRIRAVHLTIYLMFNEGYNSSHNSVLIRKDLCYEALRLANFLALEYPHQQAESFALLALLCFHTARFDARIDNHGCIIILEDQDRSLWDRNLIQKGLEFLFRSSKSDALSAYHLEASIAALHCTTANFEETNWEKIHDWYGHLQNIKPSPIIQLNRAIISGKIYGPKHAIDQLLVLTTEPKLKKYYLLYASLGQFYTELNSIKKAIGFYQKALELTSSPKEKDLLKRRIDAISI